MLSQYFTKEGVLLALTDMNSNKSTGSDSLSIELYLKFFGLFGDVLKLFMINVLNYVICPHLKNYRILHSYERQKIIPQMLTNTDQILYKLLTEKYFENIIKHIRKCIAIFNF